MISDRNIIAIASNWHFDPTSKHHLMTCLAEHNRVLWVNYHGSRRPSASAADLRAALGRLKQVIAGPRAVQQNITVLTPGLLPIPGSAWARRCNQRLVVRAIRGALAGFPPGPVQLWSFAPDVDYLVGRFGEELDLYYCVDEFSAFSGYSANTIGRLERRLMERCDLVITTAGHLEQSKRQVHPDVHLVTHGVDYAHFAQATDDTQPIPEGLRGIGGPVFGFFGLIQDWVDLDLLTQVARRRPEWSFVLIGRLDTDLPPGAAELRNLHFLGRLPYAQLPGCCRAFDVGLIPFKINRLTLNVNPIKLREYLAAGLPVVSTDLPEVRNCRPHVLIGDGVDGFERACAGALQQRSLDQRRIRQAFVQHQTWPAKVEQLSAIIKDRLAARRDGRPSAVAAGSSSSDR